MLKNMLEKAKNVFISTFCYVIAVTALLLSIVNNGNILVGDGKKERENLQSEGL